MTSVLRFGVMLMACGLPALGSPLLEERAGCNRDNLLRCYDPTGTKATDVASRSAATAFCSSLLSIPVVTSVIATSTPLSIVTSTVTTTDGTQVVTSVSTTVFTEESTITTTVPAATTSVVIGKRAADDTVVPPACAATTYALSRLSSACSCLSVTPSTAFITATAATSTSVILSTVHDTTTTTTETTTTTTQTETTTIVETTTPSAAASLGFYLRSYRSQDTDFVGNYLYTMDASTTNKIEFGRASGSNTTAPHLSLTPEGYLTIAKAQLTTSASYGTEDQTWIAFVHTPAVAEPLQFDKLANVQECANCLPLVFQKVVDSGITFLQPTDTAQAIQICSTRSPASNYNLFWLGSSPAAIDAGCTTEQLFVSDIGVPGPPLFGTPTHY